MAKLTAAGRKMIGEYIAHKEHVLTSQTLQPFYTGKDGRIFMTLAAGSGSQAATVRKLVRDGFAEGTFNWGSQSRWMIPTHAGLEAYYDHLLEEKHERDVRDAGLALQAEKSA